MQNLTFIKKSGAEIRRLFDPLAALRIAVFRDFPYLYEGSLSYEKEYLETYVRSPRSFLFAVYDGQKMVGATTALPLADESAAIRQPFEDAGMNVDSLFYFGESLLLPPYRGQGLGHRFFDEREAYAHSFCHYRKALFLSVERELNHPARPVNYRSNEAFWTKRGYQKQEHLKARMQWPDLGEQVSTPKTLVCWMRDL